VRAGSFIVRTEDRRVILEDDGESSARQDRIGIAADDR